jgi:hypothetical protein
MVELTVDVDIAAVAGADTGDCLARLDRGCFGRQGSYYGDSLISATRHMTRQLKLVVSCALYLRS